MHVQLRIPGILGLSDYPPTSHPTHIIVRAALIALMAIRILNLKKKKAENTIILTLRK